MRLPIGRFRLVAPHEAGADVRIVVEDADGVPVGFGTIPRDWPARLSLPGGYEITNTLYPERDPDVD